MNEDRSIYDMEFHDVLWIDDERICVLRVPGGWIYKFDAEDIAVLVPFHDGFSD